MSLGMESVLDELGIRHVDQHKHVTAGFLQTDCCYCSPNSGKYRLGIARTGNVAVCWTCGTHRIGETLHLLSGRPYREVFALLGQVRKGPITFESKPRGKLVLPAGLTDLLPEHRKYLTRRRLDPDELAAVWGVKGIGPGVRLAWRVFVPVTLRGETVSWTTRGVSPKQEPKYKAARPDEEAVSARDILFGEDLARHAVAVCEGPMDAMRVGPGGVALMGVKYTASQVRRLARFPVRFVVLDNDGAGRRAAEKLCRELSVFPGCTRNILIESGKDAGSANDNEINELRRMLK